MTAASNLVQDFMVEPDVFFLGIKALNTKSVEAAKDMKAHIIPVVAKHLCREIPAEVCRSGGRIDPARSALNYSLLPGRVSEATITANAIKAMEKHGIEWQRKRKDQIMGVELVFSLPPGFKDDSRTFFAECLRWVERHFPQPAQIIAAVVHLDEALPHLHIVLVPIVEHGRMDGHQVVGYKGVYTKRVNSFHDEVAQRFGLRKPHRKTKLSHAERHRLADRIITQMMADGWVGTPASVKQLRRMLIADPLPAAESMGLSAHDVIAPEPQQNAYAVAVDGAMAAPDGATALLCNAVAGSIDATHAETDHAETAQTVGPVSSSIVPADRPRPKKWVEIMTGIVPLERPAWGTRSHRPITPSGGITGRLERVGGVDAGLLRSPSRVSARNQVMLGLRAAGHMRGHAW